MSTESIHKIDKKISNIQIQISAIKIQTNTNYGMNYKPYLDSVTSLSEKLHDLKIIKKRLLKLKKIQLCLKN